MSDDKNGIKLVVEQEKWRDGRERARERERKRVKMICCCCGHAYAYFVEMFVETLSYYRFVLITKRRASTEEGDFFEHDDLEDHSLDRSLERAFVSDGELSVVLRENDWLMERERRVLKKERDKERERER